MERISYSEIPNGAFEKLREIEDLISDSGMNLHLHGLLKLRVSQLNGCAYCVDMHYKELKHIGEKEIRLYSLCVWKETPFFTEKERIALAFAEKLTNISNQEVDDEIFQQMVKHFTKEEISFLTLSISQINTWNRLMRTFQFEPGNYIVEKAN